MVVMQLFFFFFVLLFIYIFQVSDNMKKRKFPQSLIDNAHALNAIEWKRKDNIGANSNRANFIESFTFIVILPLPNFFLSSYHKGFHLCSAFSKKKKKNLIARRTWLFGLS